LEKLWYPSEIEDDDELVESLWDNALEKMLSSAVDHPMNHRFSDPYKWRGYFLVYEFVKIRAKEALAQNPRRRTHPDTPASGPVSTGSFIREQRMSALGGRLIGKPDLVVGDEVIDYKSGSIFENEDDGTRKVKAAYLRQLKIYGHLVHETTGSCPKVGKLLPIDGEVYSVDLDPADCKVEAEKAVGLLDSVNSSLSESAGNALEIASPSPSACQWCSFKLVCPAFWNSVSPDWKDDLKSGAISGRLAKPPIAIHDGKAVALTLEEVVGTSTDPQLTIKPLPVAIHDMASYSVGDEIRLVNLFYRANGSVSPYNMTVCIRAKDIPQIAGE
jgi:hypothetical protein